VIGQLFRTLWERLTAIDYREQPTSTITDERRRRAWQAERFEADRLATAARDASMRDPDALRLRLR
jgi:hypothetical protein